MFAETLQFNTLHISKNVKILPIHLIAFLQHFLPPFFTITEISPVPIDRIFINVEQQDSNNRGIKKWRFDSNNACIEFYFTQCIYFSCSNIIHTTQNDIYSSKDFHSNRRWSLKEQKDKSENQILCVLPTKISGWWKHKWKWIFWGFFG